MPCPVVVGLTNLSFMENQLKQPAGEQLFTEPPTVYRIKLYLRWLAKSRTGVLEDNITDTTLHNRLASLKRAIRLHTNHKYNEADNEALGTLIHQDLPKEGLISTAAKPKPVAPLPVAEDLNQFSWACDEYQDMHPRMRVQVSFAIVLMSALGTRPGEFVESDAWKKTNEGLIYDDIEFIHQDDDEYSGYLLKVRLRNRKGHRDNEKHAYVPP
jgi:integrase